MHLIMKIFQSQVLLFLIFAMLLCCEATTRYKFVVEETSYTRLCSTKNILTVNGKFPGPTIHVTRGETIIVDIYNKAQNNITIHWHGAKQLRNPWGDGPEYITQCPIKPGAKFSQKIIYSTEEGTLWYHGHTNWTRATLHGAVIIYPNQGTYYPFPKPHAEALLILGEWWKQGIAELYDTFIRSGGDPNISDAYTINGQPGDLYPCSKPETFKLKVDYGKTYLLRIINAALQDLLFFSIADHNLTIVGSDASYTKPFVSNYIVISPGQTIDLLLNANQPPNHRYYMAARVYSAVVGLTIDNTTTTAIIQYNNSSSSSPLLPNLPYYNDTNASFSFTSKLTSLADKNHPIDVPLKISTRMFITLSINAFPCPNNSCSGPNGTRLAASLNNISFVMPDTIDILEAYYYGINGVFGNRFPNVPPLFFNFTAEDLPLYLEIAKLDTQVKLIDYGSNVEIVFQGTNVAAGASDHPMHLHGFSFYVVGSGFGNFDPVKDPSNYNIVDPPYQNTIAVPVNGWTTIRFKADNPGVWLMHCHLERHMSWGMDNVFIVKEGKAPEERMLPRPPNMPPC